MEITLTDIGKRYGNEWIFKNVSIDFVPDDNYAILGANGSGKSTLLKIISGFTQASKGKINYSHHHQLIENETVFKYLSYAAPYLDLTEEFTCIENIQFQAKFKPFMNLLSADEVLEKSELMHAKDKLIKNFSSGMKQRLKLTLAILSDCPLLLLDEPCSNLDKKAIAWYQEMISVHASHKLKIVCSNNLSFEYEFCKKVLSIDDYKV